MSRSGKMTRCAPTRSRILPCAAVIALATMRGTPSSERTDVVRMLASTSVPIATIGRPELGRADLRHGFRVGRVALDDVRELVRVALDELLAQVDAEHLVAERDERLRERAAEAAEPDDEKLVCSWPCEADPSR